MSGDKKIMKMGEATLHYSIFVTELKTVATVGLSIYAVFNGPKSYQIFTIV